MLLKEEEEEEEGAWEPLCALLTHHTNKDRAQL